MPHQNFPDSIAIIGIGCRFPGDADDPQSYWQVLARGDCLTGRVPSERWSSGDELSPAHYGSFLSGIDLFDAAHFGISAQEARSTDPQHRLLLECTFRACEDAGLDASALSGKSVGVYVGLCNHDYRKICEQSQQQDVFHGVGNAATMAANRISYWMNLTGPSMAIDTSCSSSLVAVHQACMGLLAGDCEQAVAGGVNLLLSPHTSQLFARAGMLAADGQCKTFDAAADGYVRGEGCGVILLKPLAQALADGDRIYSVICGSAVNQDGKSNGLNAPNGLAQQQVIRSALKRAHLQAKELSYCECHGTGTALGDPIEVRALRRVRGDLSTQPLMIGSIKPSIGHLEAAAGIAGLIKVVLSLQHNCVLPQSHLKNLNPKINIGKELCIPTERVDWPAAAQPRYAGVSSFGFGGTNAHVIVADGPSGARRRSDEVRSKYEFKKQSYWAIDLNEGARPVTESVSAGKSQEGDLPESQDTIITKLQELLHDLLLQDGRDEFVDQERSLAELGIDSLVATEFMMTVRETWRIELTPLDVNPTTNLGDLASLILDRR